MLDDKGALFGGQRLRAEESCSMSSMSCRVYPYCSSTCYYESGLGSILLNPC